MAAVVLDSELLLLLVVGSASRRYIRVHKKLKSYTESDYDLLLRLVGSVPAAFVTPNTLTETSNLAGYVAEPARSQIYTKLRDVIGSIEERYRASRDASAAQEFLRLGLTDSALLELGGDETVLVTADLGLYLAAASRGQKVINFNHEREAAGTT